MCELAAYYLIIDTKNIQGKAQKRLSITACWTLSIELIETFSVLLPIPLSVHLNQMGFFVAEQMEK
ncbi:hypothetical protein WB50_15335 [Vibrio cholerae O1 biovar El Tor]|nr:hypothetical protein WB50_15335 [Vibrio cholerae O1 biovar El Tor]